MTINLRRVIDPDELYQMERNRAAKRREQRNKFLRELKLRKKDINNNDSNYTAEDIKRRESFIPIKPTKVRR